MCEEEGIHSFSKVPSGLSVLSVLFRGTSNGKGHRMSHALLCDEDESSFGELGEGGGGRRIRLLGSSTLGPQLKEDADEFKDIFFAILWLVSVTTVVIVGLINGTQVLMLSAPDVVVVSPVDSSTIVEHDQREFSRMSLFGGVVLVSMCGCAMSMGALGIFCRFSKQIVELSVFGTVGTLFVSGLFCFAMGSVAGGVVLILLALLSFLVYHFFLRHRLALASTILHIASQAISHITLVFYCAILMIAQLSFSLLWLMAVIGTATNEGTESQNKGCSTFSFSGTYVLGPAMTLSCPTATCKACVCDNNTRIASATNPCFEPKLLPSQLFGLLLVYLWVSNTLSGVVHCGVSKATASWWGRAEGAPVALMALGFRKALTTNFGSIALGSLLVSIIQLSRVAVEFSSRALQQGAGSSIGNSHRRCSVIRAFALSCLGAALSALDHAAVYFNKYAFCYVSIFNMTFVDASKAVVGLFAHRGWTALINDDLIEVVLLFSHISVGVAVMLLAFVYTHIMGLNLTDSTLVVATGLFVGYAFGSTATRALASAAMTIFVCWAERPDVFSDAHPDLCLLLQAAWRELPGFSDNAISSEDSASGGLAAREDDKALKSPQYVRKSNTPTAPAPAATHLPKPGALSSGRHFVVAATEPDEDSDESPGDEPPRVLNLAPMQSRGQGVGGV